MFNDFRGQFQLHVMSHIIIYLVPLEIPAKIWQTTKKCCLGAQQVKTQLRFPCRYPFPPHSGDGIPPKILVLIADPRHAFTVWWQTLGQKLDRNGGERSARRWTEKSLRIEPDVSFNLDLTSFLSEVAEKAGTDWGHANLLPNPTHCHLVSHELVSEAEHLCQQVLLLLLPPTFSGLKALRKLL